MTAKLVCEITKGGRIDTDTGAIIHSTPFSPNLMPLKADPHATQAT